MKKFSFPFWFLSMYLSLNGLSLSIFLWLNVLFIEEFYFWRPSSPSLPSLLIAYLCKSTWWGHLLTVWRSNFYLTTTTSIYYLLQLIIWTRANENEWTRELLWVEREREFKNYYKCCTIYMNEHARRNTKMMFIGKTKVV